MNKKIFIFILLFLSISFVNSTTFNFPSDEQDINIFIQNVTDLCDLNDTVCTSLENNNLLSWDSSLLRWRNKNPINFRWGTNGFYLYNDSSTIYFNETQLNETIDLRSVTDSEIIFKNNSEQIYIRENYPNYLNVSDALFVNGTSGNIGIGTTTPEEILDVNDDILIRGSIEMRNSLNNVSIFFPDTNRLLYGGLDIDFSDVNVIAENIRSRNSTGIGIYDENFNLGVFINDSGFVGIGKNNPIYALDINGNVALNDTLRIFNSVGTSPATFYSADRLYYAGKPIDFSGVQLINSRFQGSSGNGLSLYNYQNVLGVYINDTSGYVGIAQTAPTARLDVKESTSTLAPLRIRNGSSVTIGSSNYGDIWYDSIGLNFNYNGKIKHLSPERLVYVHSLADFPAPISGYIHLENKHYIIMDSIEIDANNGDYGFWIDADTSPQITGYKTIGYKNQNPATDALFKSNDTGGGLILFDDLNVYSDGSGKLFDLNSSDPSSFLVLHTFAAGGFYSLGRIEAISYFGFIVNYVEEIADGLTFVDNSAIAIQSHRFNDWYSTFYNFNATFITIQGTQQNIQINNNFFQPDSTEKSIYLHPNMTTSGGSVVGNAFDFTKGGVVFQSGSKRQNDTFWTYSGNTNLADSTSIAYSYFQNGVNVTTVTLPNTYYNVNATWITKTNERVTTANGNWSYIGIEDIQMNGRLELKIDPTSGAATTWEASIFKNGIRINDSSSALIDIPAGFTGFLSMETIEPASTGDYFQVYVQRTAGAGDFTTESGKFTILKV